MALAVDAVSNSGNQSNTDPWSWSHTVSGSDRVLVVTVSSYFNAPTGVTYNGDAMTLVQDAVSGNFRASIWILIAPDTGTNTVSVDFANLSYGIAGAISFTGADQTTQPNASTDNGDSQNLSNASTLSVTTTADNAYIVDAIAVDASANTLEEDGTQTQIYDSEPTFIDGGSSYKSVGTAGSYDMDWTWTFAIGMNTAHVGLAVNPLADTSTIEQEGFAFGDDDGSESAHTLDTQDTNVTEALGTKTLRVLLNATDDPASTAFKLKYQKNGAGGYVDVPLVASTTPEISFVGSTTNSAVNGGNVALTLTNILDLAEGDLVLLAYSIGDDEGTNQTMSIASGTGWSSAIVDIHSDDDDDVDLAVFWKIMGSSPDTSVTVAGNGQLDSSTAAIAMAFRGVDQTTPIDVTPTTDTGANSSHANPPSINHNGSTGTAVVAVGAAGHTSGGSTTFTGGTGYTTNFVTVASDDSTDTTLGMGYNLSPSDPEDPPAFTHSSSTTVHSWAAATIALRPAAGVTNEVYVSTSANVTAGGEATTARLTAPSGKTTSDFDTGRRWDDENGSDSIDITEDDYTELEWVLTTQSPADTDDYFEFRVYAGDDALDTYTVTPKWTIGTSGTPVTVNAGVQTTTVAINSPTVTGDAQLAPNAQTVTASQPAPTITAVRNVSLSPGVQTVTTAVVSPDLSVNETLAQDAQTLTVAVNSPTVTAIRNVTIEPNAQSLTVSLGSPTITIGDGASVGVQTLTVSQADPTVSTTWTVTQTPNAQTLTTVINSPTVSTIRNITVEPNAQSLTVSLPDPDILAGRIVDVDRQTATIAVNSPTVSGDAQIAPDAQAVTVSVLSPTVSTGVTLSPDAQSVTVAQEDPTILAGKVVPVDPQTATISLPTPTVTTVRYVTVSPLAQTLTTTINSVIVQAVDESWTTQSTPTTPYSASSTPTSLWTDASAPETSYASSSAPSDIWTPDGDEETSWAS